MLSTTYIYLISFTSLLIICYLLHFKFKSASYIIMAAGVFSSLAYIIWRFTVIPITGISLIFGIALFLAEVMGIIQFFSFEYFSTRKYKLEKKVLKDPYSEDLPSVDILICTYNEPVALLKKTAIAAKNLNYNPKKLNVFICDDGKRDDVKKLCSDYNINYVTRDSNEGAKAGNINNALKIANSEYVSILDADMIAKSNFLEKTIEYFLDDENLAFVQVPQSYYNADMYQYNMSVNVPNEQDLFMRDIQEARASINAVLHVGTNAIFRRCHLDAVGGFPTFSITEDMALGMLLQAKGFNSLLVNEPLVLGLSATTLEESIKQRKRWARGNVQVFKKHNPLFKKGLNFKQRVAYFDGLLYWFSSIQKIIYILAPICYLLFGVLSIDAPPKVLLAYYIPFFLSQIMVFKILSPGTRGLKWSHYYETVMAFSISVSILLELFSIRSVGFKVTSKDVVHHKSHFQFEFVLPHIIVFLVTLLSWFISIYNLGDGTFNISYVFLNIIWSVYNGFGLFTALKIAYQKPIFRTSERVDIKNGLKTSFSSNSTTGNILIQDISGSGMGMKLLDETNLEINDPISINLNDTLLSGKIVRKKDSIIGIHFTNLNPDQNTELIKLYVDNLKPYHVLKRDKHLLET